MRGGAPGVRYRSSAALAGPYMSSNASLAWSTRGIWAVARPKSASQIGFERPLAPSADDLTYTFDSLTDVTSFFLEPVLVAVDCTEMQASPISPNDVVVVTLGTVTNARNVSFSRAEGFSSARRQGGPMSTEIIMEMAGEDISGQPLRLRQAVVHPQGQMSPTGLGVAMVLERLAGLDGAAPAAAGLHFPSQLLDADTYLERLARTGGEVLRLDPAA